MFGRVYWLAGASDSKPMSPPSARPNVPILAKMQIAPHANFAMYEIGVRVWLSAHPANFNISFTAPPCQPFSNARKRHCIS